MDLAISPNIMEKTEITISSARGAARADAVARRRVLLKEMSPGETFLSVSAKYEYIENKIMLMNIKFHKINANCVIAV